jgi:AmmeMemoRadiSam system protein B
MSWDVSFAGTERNAMPVTLERPRLRPGLAAAKDGSDPRYVFLWDQLRVSNRPQRLTILEFMWVQMLDGERTLRDIQAEVMRQLGGEFLPLDWFISLVQNLDEALFLDSPRFREYLAAPVREPTCIGCYEGEPEALRRQLTGLFTGPKGPGLPRRTRPNGALRAALIPHIDYQRGGATFAWGFKEVVERTDASLFVIIGTSHYSGHRFTLTRKDFKTPLGIAATEQTYIDRLVSHYGDGLFEDELAHLPEHSIELEVVLLQYLYENRRPIRIVPLLVGSFADCVLTGSPSPSAFADIARMVKALRRAEAETPEPICYIISGDLAHIGPKFGDPLPLDEAFLSHSCQQDQAILRQAEAADPAGFFGVIAAEGDRRRICGLPPTYTLLEAVRPHRGRVLHYDQYVHPRGLESVSFASVGFYR